MSTTMTTRRNRDTPGHKYAEIVESRESEIAPILPAGVSGNRIIQSFKLAGARNPDLYQCTRYSIVQALKTAAELGVEVSGTLGSAYLVPYRNRAEGTLECQLIIGYRGLIDLCRRSGDIARIEAEAVYESDAFDAEYGMEPRLRHVPDWGGERSDGRIRLFYAMATFTDGGKQFTVLPRDEVDAIRARSRAGQAGPWKDHFAEMGKKTAVRRLVKMLPISMDAADAIARSEEAEFGSIREATVVAVPDGHSKTQQMAAALAPSQDETPGDDADDTTRTPPEETDSTTTSPGASLSDCIRMWALKRCIDESSALRSVGAWAGRRLGTDAKDMTQEQLEELLGKIKDGHIRWQAYEPQATGEN